MTTGEIILLPFPFAELTNKTVRPAVVVCETADKYRDLVVSAISSVVSDVPGENEIAIDPDLTNRLRTASVIKVDRIVALKRQDVIAHIGKLDPDSLKLFKDKFKRLVD